MGEEPTTAESCGLGCMGFMNAALGTRFLPDDFLAAFLVVRLVAFLAADFLAAFFAGLRAAVFFLVAIACLPVIVRTCVPRPSRTTVSNSTHPRRIYNR